MNFGCIVLILWSWLINFYLKIYDNSLQENGPLDLENFSSVAELESVGLDSLKSALMALGMKCGGTLQQRAERLFLVKGVKQEMIDPSLLAKPSKGKKSKGK